MAKLFEKVDDNPGDYFGMLVEGYDSTYASVMKQADSDAQKLRDSWEKDGGKSLFDTLSELGYESDYEDSPYMFKDADGGNTIVFDFRPINSFEDYVTYFVVDKDNRIPDGWTKTKLMIDFWKDKNESLKEDKKYLRNWIEKKVGKQMSNMKPTKLGYKQGRPYYSIDFIDGTSDDYFIDFNKKEIEKCESLKEDKFVSRDKMSKKDKKELDSKKRNTWGNTNPVTRVQPNKKAYDRKRDKKAIEEDYNENYYLNEFIADCLEKAGIKEKPVGYGENQITILYDTKTGEEVNRLLHDELLYIAKGYMKGVPNGKERFINRLKNYNRKRDKKELDEELNSDELKQLANKLYRVISKYFSVQYEPYKRVEPVILSDKGAYQYLFRVFGVKLNEIAGDVNIKEFKNAIKSVFNEYGDFNVYFDKDSFYYFYSTEEIYGVDRKVKYIGFRWFWFEEKGYSPKYYSSNAE